MAKGNAVKMGITVFCLVGSVAALYNVYHDNSELKKRAETRACGAEGCFKMLGEQRTAISQTFTFQVQGGSVDTRIIKCERSLLLVGSYGCQSIN